MTYDLIADNRAATDAMMRIRVLCKNHRTCIQAGGLFGVWPVEFARAFAWVMTFEPQRDNFKRLYEATNDIDNIYAMYAALGREKGRVSLTRSESDNSGAWYCAPGNDVDQITIDSFCCDYVDLIYLDIEGGETDALLGAVETIKRCRPVIGLEDKKNEFWRRYGYNRSPVDMLVLDFNYVQASHCNHDRIMIPAETA